MGITNEEYTEGHRQLYRVMPNYSFGSQRASVSSPKDAPEDVGVRLYSTAYGQSWELQIRAFFQTRNYKEGKKWYLAGASLGIDDIKALHSACEQIIEEASEA